MIKVCYFTSKASSDIRVFEKECVSLVNAGYDVTLICPNAKTETKKGVKVIGVEYTLTGECNRLVKLPKLLYQQAISVNADIYHFNDPACLPFVNKLKKKGKKVIFDSFEDHPALLFEKKRISKVLLKLISRVYTYYEYNVCKKLDGLICCYHWTRDRLVTACPNCELVFNFPIIEDDDPPKIKSNNIITDKLSICYAGLISHIWSITSILQSLEKVNDVIFNFAGWGDSRFIQELKRAPGWRSVNFMGKITREEVKTNIYQKSDIGMALLDYIPLCKGNIGNLSNNKLFEYMSAGLPVICTDFVLWKEIVEKNKCGICVNPHNIQEVIDALNYFATHKDKVQEMGNNGRKLVLQEYNWGTQRKVMLRVYEKCFVNS